MHKNRFFVFVSSFLLFSTVLFGKSPDRDVLFKVSDVLSSFVEDFENGELKDMKLSELEMAIERITPIEQIGLSNVQKGLVEFRYAFRDSKVVDSSYGFTVLVTIQGDDLRECKPRSVLLTHISPSGIEYYHSIVPLKWSVLVETEKQKLSKSASKPSKGSTPSK